VHRLEAVEAKIRSEGSVGPINSSASWIDGTVNATAATFPNNENVMFFFSDDDNQFLGIAGSAHNVLGNLRPETAINSTSHLSELLNTLDGIATTFAFVVQKNDAALSHFVNSCVTEVGGRSPWTYIMMGIAGQFEGLPTTPISFLARRLTSDLVESNGKRYTLASPLYIVAEDIQSA